MGLLNIQIDTSKLEAWASTLSANGFRNAARRGLDQAARAARKITIPIIAADIGVSPAKIKAATPKVRASTASDLSARWVVNKLRINIASVSGAVVSKASGLQASTFRLSGGGSASLSIGKAFLVRANGGTFVAFRRTGERLPLKSVFAETPSTALAEDGAAARVVWQKAANAELVTRLPNEIQKQMISEGLSAASPDNSGD